MVDSYGVPTGLTVMGLEPLLVRMSIGFGFKLRTGRMVGKPVRVKIFGKIFRIKQLVLVFDWVSTVIIRKRRNKSRLR